MPRKNNPKETVERVIAAAMKLFNEKGFEKTSMQDIVDESDMSKGAIFYHFASKEEIFEAALEKQYEYVTEMISVWLSEMEGLTGKEKLIGLVAKNLTDEKFVASSNEFMRLITSPHLILGHMKRNIAHGVPLVAGIIREGIADGSIVTEFPVESAELLLHLLNYWCDPVVFGGDMEAVRGRLKCLRHIMKSLGVDILSDEMTDKFIEFTVSLYGGKI